MKYLHMLIMLYQNLKILFFDPISCHKNGHLHSWRHYLYYFSHIVGLFKCKYMMILDSENPICICSSCCTTLQSFSTFKKKCLKNYSRWKHYTQNFQETNQTQLQSYSELRIKIEDKNEDTWLSSEEPDVCRTVEEETIDVKEELLAPEESADRELYPHFVKCETVSHDEQDGGSSVTSPLDRDETNSKTCIDSQVFNCLMCTEVFTDKLEYYNHINIHIKDLKGVECPICKKKFSQKSNLSTHMKIHLGIKDFGCTLCTKKFTRSCDLYKHMQFHLDVKGFECEICTVQFNTKILLNRHMKIHSNITDYECTICKKKFGQIFNLKRHMKYHFGKKIFAEQYMKGH